MNRRRRFALVGAALTGLLVLLIGGAIAVLQSSWFRDRVRERIITETERVTGGRVEVGNFRFDWKRLRAEVSGFVVHGTEARASAPLFRANSVAIDLRLASVLRKPLYIDSLEVRAPTIHLMIDPSGRTNVPEPKIKSRTGKPVMQTILDLAVRRFDIRDGSFAIEGHGSTPFQMKGENLEAKLAYDLTGPRYQGNLSVRPFDLKWGSYENIPAALQLAVILERNRLAVTNAALTTGKSALEFSGSVSNFASPVADFHYRARVDAGEAGHILKWKSVERGTVMANGTLRYDRVSRYTISGPVRASGVAYYEKNARFEDVRADGALQVTPARIRISGIQLSGTALAALGGDFRKFPLHGAVSEITAIGRDVDIRGLTVSVLGGEFRGTAAIRNLERFQVEGQVDSFDIGTVAQNAAVEMPPYDGRMSGSIRLQGSLRDRQALELSTQLEITPSGAGTPVRGLLSVNYDARGGALDFGRSFLALPSTRMELSGSLATRLSFHLESTNLRDLDPVLPLISANAPKTSPVELRSGRAAFSGAANGSLDNPRITGQLALTNFAYENRAFDVFEASLDLSPSEMSVTKASLVRGKVRVDLNGKAGFQEWRLRGGSPISVSASVRNAPIAEVLAIAKRQDLPVLGTVSATMHVSGTMDHPTGSLSLSAAKGSVYGEPFDGAALSATYSSNRIQLTSGKLTAGRKQIEFKGAYTHAAGAFTSGEAHFEVASNQLELSELQTVRQRLPGISGTMEVNLNGATKVASKAGQGLDLHLTTLMARVDSGGLALGEQPLGDLHLTATTKGDVLTASVQSGVASASFRGSGEWRLSDDYPGKLRLSFTKLDFGRVQQIVSGGKRPALEIGGFAGGDLELTGPVGHPERWNGTLRIPDFQLGPAPKAALGVEPKIFTLRNSGPIVVTMRQGVAHIDSARLVGRATDIQLSGTISPRRENALDLRADGRIDLAVLQDFDSSIVSSGTVVTNVTCRGTFSRPQVNGKLDIKNSAFSMADFPNGISGLNGVILFGGRGATIQQLTGESGGGKVRLAGFAGMENDVMVFRLRAVAQEVRVRYPEGVSTVANAALTWTGTSDNNIIAGTVTILRTGFNPHSDLGSVLAGSAQPVRTPAARSGILGGMHFDIQIESAPDITFQSSLAQDVVAEANLRVRGTLSNPAALGRINILQGQLTFFGTHYRISQGSISFFNPVRIEPILNIDLETKARGVDVLLNVSGPIGKLNLTPRSDPPMPFNEIVALLATGRTPSTNLSGATQQITANQSWQQMGASALVAEAVATPVAGRLQRFFVITKLRIDPSITGVEFNPQARITIEQQITPNITFTYITNVTNSNPLIVQVEWALNPRWSVLAVRDENGLFGLDFFFKKRF